MGRVRFIPACAGNANHPLAVRADQPVHSRVCGERARSSPLQSRDTGSSPRVRGTRRSSSLPPVRAGSSPRVRGTPPMACLRSAPHGSSPRVRGTLDVGLVKAPGRRFIPACAGNAARPRRRSRPVPVHPRVCGERCPADQKPAWFTGSSPRVRGTLATLGLPGAHGSSPRVRGTPNIPRAPTVHPRVCGERPTSRAPYG